MQVPRTWLDNFTDRLNSTSEAARAELARQLRAIDYSRPDDEVRRDVLAVMDACCGGASDMAAREASAFYDGMRERVLGRRMGAFAQSMREPIATEKAVRAFLKELFEGDYDEFEELCLGRVDYEVKRSAGRCVQYNVGRDPYRGDVRWARVPTGDETCEFCIMLASRGPVYHTEETAGGDHPDHYHAHCDCRIVPFWGTYELGPSRRASALMDIEGYDPDALYERYLGSKFATGYANGKGGRSTSHPMVWAEAKRKGLVTLGSIGEVEAYVKGATSYQDLFDRIDLVSREWEHYALSDSVRREIQNVMYRTRQRLLKQGG